VRTGAGSSPRSSKKLAEKYNGSLDIIKVDVDANPGSVAPSTS